MDAPIGFLTGAGSGTGRAIALAMARAGYRLVLIGRNRAALTETMSLLPGSHDLAEADLRDAEAIETAMRAALARHDGRIDALVNAAGITGPLAPSIGDFPVSDFDEVISVNLRACFVTLSVALPAMYARGAGRVVSIGGTHGQRGRPGRAAYVASKWGLRGLHRSAALEAGPHGVTVNLVMPGPIDVPRMRGLFAAEAAGSGQSEDEVLAAYKARMGGVLGRLTTPEEVAGIVAFLLGDATANVTGQEFTIDGGTII